MHRGGKRGRSQSVSQPASHQPAPIKNDLGPMIGPLRERNFPRTLLFGQGVVGAGEGGKEEAEAVEGCLAGWEEVAACVETRRLVAGIPQRFLVLLSADYKVVWWR